MEDWQQRVIQEQNELNDKIERLKTYLNAVPVHAQGINYVMNKQVPEQTISDECKWCAENEPEWSDYAKCWIHRRTTVDKRCLRLTLSPNGMEIE